MATYHNYHNIIIIIIIILYTHLIMLQWLEKDFLGYLKEWEDSVETRTDVPKAEKPTMLLSRATREGLRITGKYYELTP